MRSMRCHEDLLPDGDRMQQLALVLLVVKLTLCLLVDKYLSVRDVAEVGCQKGGRQCPATSKTQNRGTLLDLAKSVVAVDLADSVQQVMSL